MLCQLRLTTSSHEERRFFLFKVELTCSAIASESTSCKMNFLSTDFVSERAVGAMCTRSSDKVLLVQAGAHANACRGATDSIREPSQLFFRAPHHATRHLPSKTLHRTDGM
eukprot:c25873_g1_i1.p1 GENE.c25873_g1_i1~~c25873_g1_i1.p1  ORF type:complete len:111 (-),score=9.45 c25873_g1_i1:40-372(-)